MLDKNRYMTLSCIESKNNNCLFGCLRKLFSEIKMSRADKIRKDLKLKNGLISYQDIPKIIEYLKINSHIEVYNHIGEIIIECNNYNINNTYRLALVAEHYYVIEEIESNKKCEDCGMIYKETHECNIDTIMYYNNNITKNNLGNYIKPKSNKKIQIEQDIINDMFIFDLETFGNKESNDIHNVYALGYSHKNQYKQYYGKESGNELLKLVSSLNGTIFSAFNGSKFDYYFILKHIARTAKWHRFILDNGRILSIEWYNTLPDNVVIN